MAVRSQEMRNTVSRTASINPQPVIMTPSVSPHTLAYIVTALLALVAISAVMGNVVGWGREQIDTFRYGNPRTFQLAEAIGHDDSPASPTRLIAMNLNRQVVVIEIPGGDASKIRTINGPYLFGADEDKTPVLMRLADLNNDGTKDLVVTIKNEELVYLNKEGQFKLINADERAALAK